VTIVVVATIAMIGAAVAGWHYARVSSPPSGPIILVSIDTLRADHLPAYGYRKVKTPAIDRLAAEGIVFERAYAHSPQTFPSHVALLSGQLPFENGVRDNAGFTIGPNLRLLPKMLQNRGWTTGGVVSAYVLRRELGLDRGFTFFDSRMPQAAPSTPATEVQRPGVESLAIAEHWMAGLSSTRFFLFFHIYEPHAPYAPPQRFAGYAPYDGEIAYSDEIVGQLFDWLKKRGWYDQATVILLSDHGEGLGDHGEREHGLFVYNEVIHVPLIIKMPKGAGGGRRIATPVQHIDLVPTILDWLGAPRPARLRGRSLRALIDNGTPPAETGFYAESLYGRYRFGWSELYAVTDARYQFIRAPRSELYDLEQDLKEKHNVTGERPQPAQAMRGALDRLLAGATVQVPTPVSREDLEKLQALGYVGTQQAISPDIPGDTLPDPKDKAGALEACRRARDLAVGGQHEAAIELLRTVTADNPMMSDAWLLMGLQQMRTGRNDDALQSFKRLVELDPSSPDGLVNVAAVLVALGKPDDADANGELALKVVPQDDRRARLAAYQVLVRAAIGRKDEDAARQYAEQAAQEEPGFPLPSYVAGVKLWSDAKYAEAAVPFTEAMKALEDRTVPIPDLYYYAGDTFARLKRNAEAQAAFKENIRLSPGAAIQARAALASLYKDDGRTAEAEAVVADLLRDVPSADGYNAAIKLWTSFGEPARANALRARARELAARRPPAR
jgi:arylsulfatase A-like enzyme/Tfp pilus assembly protein PilF